MAKEQTGDQAQDAPTGVTPLDRRALALAGIERAREDVLKAGGLILEDEPDPVKGDDGAAEGDDDAKAKAQDTPDDDGADPGQRPDDDQGDDDGGDPGEEPASAKAGKVDKVDKSGKPTGETYRVMIDGEEREVSLSELTRAYQLSGASESRLNLASNVLRQVEDLNDKLRRGEPIDDKPDKPKSGTKTKDAAGGADDDPLAGIDFKETVRRLQYEDPEDGAQALRDLVMEVSQRANGGSNLSPEQITRAVMDQVKFEQAVLQFGSKYQDITKDQYLSMRTGAKTKELYDAAVSAYRTNRTPMPSYDEILTEAGEDTRKWLRSVAGQAGSDSDADPNPAPTPDPTTSSTMNDRIERKRISPQPPAGRGGPGKSAKSDNPAEPLTPVQRHRSAIAEIKASRGQAA